MLKFELNYIAPVKTIQVFNIETKEITTAKSVRELCRELPLNFSSVLAVLNKGEQYVYSGYAFWYTIEKDWDTNSILPKSIGKIITAVNKLTNEIMEFSSVNSASRYFSVDKRNVLNKLKTGALINGWWLVEK